MKNTVFTNKDYRVELFKKEVKSWTLENASKIVRQDGRCTGIQCAACPFLNSSTCPNELDYRAAKAHQYFMRNGK